MGQNGAIGILVLGIAAILLSALADVFQFGDRGFGQAQVAGCVVGVVLVLVGVAMRRRGSHHTGE